MRNRITYIDTAKGIGIILIVVGHMLPVKAVIHVIFAFHVPLFFIISGFLPVDPNYTIGQIVKKKAFSLMYPYLTFSIIDIIWGVLFKYYLMGMQI